MQGYVLARPLMPKAGSGQVAARGRQLVPCSFFLSLPLGSCSVNVTLCVLMPKFQLQPHDLLVYKQKAFLVLEYELKS